MEKLLYLNIGASEIIMLIILFGVLPSLILTIYCLFDITRSKFKDPTNKLLWTLIVLFLAPIIGSILYLVLGRSQKISAESVPN